MDKLNVVQPYNGNYLAIKKNEVLTPATTWMNLINIMLSEKRQTRKTIYLTIPFTWNIQKRQTYRDGKCISGPLGLGWERNYREWARRIILGSWTCSHIGLSWWLYSSVNLLTWVNCTLKMSRSYIYIKYTSIQLFIFSKLNVHPLYDPVILLLGIYPRKKILSIWKLAYWMFIAAIS